MVSSPVSSSRAAYEAYLDTLPIQFPTFTCCLCQRQSRGWGNNPAPFPRSEDNEKCCDFCNAVVLVARLSMIGSRNRQQDFNPDVWIQKIRNNDADVEEAISRFGPRIPEPQPE